MPHPAHTATDPDRSQRLAAPQTVLFIRIKTVGGIVEDYSPNGARGNPWDPNAPVGRQPPPRKR